MASNLTIARDKVVVEREGRGELCFQPSKALPRLTPQGSVRSPYRLNNHGFEMLAVMKGNGFDEDDKIIVTKGGHGTNS
uniref:Uncharacterized protein n=1 Tax=Oryza brachyantha TaxID=4533 RepID=J3N103_ORYBR